MGAGVSGGEEGALNGASIMPGGSESAWPEVKPILQSIAAKASDGTPCCQWIGPAGSGHFVKMIHNGIEYGDMQLIAEAYWVMKNLLGLDNGQMAEIFADWKDGVPGVEIAEDGDGRAVRELREDLRVRLRVRAQAQIAVCARGLGLKFVAGREEGDAEILRHAETERPRDRVQIPGQPVCVVHIVVIPDLCQHGRDPRPADLADDRARPGLHAVRQRIDGLHVDR